MHQRLLRTAQGEHGPCSSGDLYDALHAADVSAALAAGLHCRPVEDTVADTWAWLQDLGGRAPQRPDQPSVGLAPEVEARILQVTTGPEISG